MGLTRMYALLRRHLIAVAVILVLTAAAAWDIKTSPTVYAENADVIFTAPGQNYYSTLSAKLIPAANLMTEAMLSPVSRQKARQAGANADFSLGLVNLYNEQFPWYGDPYTTVTVQSASRAKTSQAFQIVIYMFRKEVAVEQARAGVRPRNFIALHVVADTGPLSRPGSRRRALAGLAVLAMILLFLVTRFLDRHPATPALRRIQRNAPGLIRQWPQDA